MMSQARDRADAYRFFSSQITHRLLNQRTEEEPDGADGPVDEFAACLVAETDQDQRVQLVHFMMGADPSLSSRITEFIMDDFVAQQYNVSDYRGETANEMVESYKTSIEEG